MNDIKYKISRVGLHFFEEPCLSGERGSGTIFFTGCNLQCLYCQNYEISHGGKGLEINETQLINAMLYLQGLGAHNINLVTPSIWASKLATTLKKAKEVLNIPIVWNSSGFESVRSLEKLNEIVDIYLPDFKYSDDNLALNYSGARGYHAIARDAIEEMRRQQPIDSFDDGIMQKGVIVRHLVLPNEVENTRGVLKNIAEIDRNMFVSLMGQYFPTPAVYTHPKLARRVSEAEYELVTEAFFDAGLKNGFSQDLDSAIEDYVPSFDIDVLRKIIE